jgi:hypothetical protein
MPLLSAPRQAHGNLANIAAARPDAHRLSVAASRDRQTGAEAWSAHGHFDRPAAHPAGDVAGDPARNFGPGSGDRATAVDNVGRDLEIIAVAGAAQILVQGVWPCERIVHSATNALAAARRCDRAGADPGACKLGETIAPLCESSRRCGESHRRCRSEHHEADHFRLSFN